jgi:hypothetical protein
MISVFTVTSAFLALPVLLTTTLTDAAFFWYDRLLIDPLRVVFLNGPRVYGVGFWQGRSESDICRELSNGMPDQIFWEHNREQCSDNIEDVFRSFANTLQALVYLYALSLTLVRSFDWVSSEVSWKLKSVFLKKTDARLCYHDNE